MTGGVQHSERAHAILSASGAHRWIACPPSARLEARFPDTTSEAALEGTLAHELAELKLRHYFFTTDLTRRKYTSAVNKLKKNPLWQAEMERYTDEYLDYVKGVALALREPPSVKIEARVNFGAYTHREQGDRIEGTGIADCILIYGQTLHIVDFKYGKGVPVAAEHNPQLSLYALGAYDAFRILYPIHSVRMTIVQPRVSPEPLEWLSTIEELLDFGEKAKEAAALAWEGKGDFHPDEDTCRFCRARSQCRARADKNAALAFAAHKLPPLITAEEAGDYLRKGKDIAAWIKDLQDWALAECLAGKKVPGWKAVEGRSVREWTDMDAAFDQLTASGIVPEEMLYEKRPLTLAQVEKLVGKARFAEAVGDYVEKKTGKPALAEETDKRPAISNKITANEAFQEVIDR